jgi:hypothetical protein
MSYGRPISYKQWAKSQEGKYAGEHKFNTEVKLNGTYFHVRGTFCLDYEPPEYEGSYCYSQGGYRVDTFTVKFCRNLDTMRFAKLTEEQEDELEKKLSVDDLSDDDYTYEDYCADWGDQKYHELKDEGKI